VTRVAGDDPIRPVWHNDFGGLTFALGTTRYAKWSPPDGDDLTGEAARLRWAGAYGAVPAVLEGRADLLVTAALPGRSAVDPQWLASPEVAVAGLGRGLRALHDALPVAGCPFTWSADERVADARRRAHELDPSAWHPDHRHLTVPDALAAVADPPPVDRLVVCQGDACAPNTVLADDGTPVGHVDLGALGVADRWADLAVATWSTVWNYGAGHEDALLAAYGVAPDPARTAYYRLLWELGP
jgi:kanamycin kinase